MDNTAKKWILLPALAACGLSLFAQTPPPAKKTAAAEDVIFDSDMGPDYDDVGAMALLHHFADAGKIHILATMASTRYDNVAAVLNVFNTYFHREDLPIGVPRKNGLLLRDGQHWTDSLVAHYPHRIKSNGEVPEPVELYRKILSAQPDKSVTMITVGFLTNLADLLKSGPDKHSRLNGYDLVRKKVKRLVSMAGKYPSGWEFNIDQDIAAAAYTYDHWPTTVWFSGFEIGEKIKTGIPLIHNESIQHSPVKEVFGICIPLSPEDSAGRKSWDETAVLVAVTGYQPYYSLKKGRIRITSDGKNSWDPLADGQYYLVEKQSPVEVQKQINQLIQHQPR